MAIRYLNPAASTTNTNWNQTDVSYLAQGETSNIWNSTANDADLVVTLNDFADLASFELTDKEEGIFKNLDVDEKTVNDMIMQAREKWFTEEK